MAKSQRPVEMGKLSSSAWSLGYKDGCMPFERNSDVCMGCGVDGNG